MLMPVEDALARVLASATPTPSVLIPLNKADGYTLADDVRATRTQPPFAASAMDGYAVRWSDLALDKKLSIIGEAAAGHRYQGILQPGNAVRIFTGAPLPDGADTILIQEDAEKLSDGEILPTEIPPQGDYVRPAGMDFHEEDVLLNKGTVLNFQSLSLAAAMNHPRLPVHRKPRVGILSNGDELVMPGEQPKDDQIISSNAFGVASLIQATGGEIIEYGIARDRIGDITSVLEQSQEDHCDILVTLGGASVGDHDLIKPALTEQGAMLDFWKIAMRPGKPFMFGKLNHMLIMGMPGNPVSSLVCSLLFLKPLLLKMQSRDPAYPIDQAILGESLGKNSQRQAYLRATVTRKENLLTATAFKQQDSSILSVLAKASALIIRPPYAEPAAAGDPCEIMWLQ